MEFRDKFIAFVDLLGFKGFVAQAELGGEPSLERLLEVAELLKYFDYRDRVREGRGLLCPYADSEDADLDYEVTQVSDCVVISAELSPAGLINLVNHCWGAVYALLLEGHMCRGYVTRGQIYHSGSQFIGSGYQRALEQEAQVTAFKRTADERGTPFVEVDTDVATYAMSLADPCVLKMFRRLVHNEQGTHVLFPFRRLSHGFIVAGGPLPFDPEQERARNQTMREIIQRTQSRVGALVDQDNPSAVSKSEHYLAALEGQLRIADQTDDVIDKFSV